jgi:hypothetical protein
VYGGFITNQPNKEHTMSKRSFTDADNDTYTVELGESGENIVITYDPSDSAGTELLIFKVEDSDRLATMILDVALEGRK